ncbi:MBL fold metallo-hydrolase [Glycomyces algeriensis]|uniref:MBL fold metallo-hydrolase n=1 Tax=Glycomyces algeriensis TaxID=256037 RepID=A0A9W6LGC5_9ACTN|nr:MBL fold metallo-hydrolase [Glycomyces algeriensis]MDA1364816.1 MBL fold metallo-hydrolase [Glycomyces algeriensis]MDR7350125.1 L-ascorbate metabolism protein UlaG (beta-lactamase superfamily) [Glycomyces algeriensis]GLI42837.1 MBL fold metallo-hydrolase [Glycomyces algeriensis]
MRLTKFGHSCVRFDTDGGAFVIDPGVFSDPAALHGVEAVFITHQHADHCNDPELRRLLEDQPETRIYGPESLTETLGSLPFTTVSDGDAIPVAGTEVKVIGRHHAVIHPDLPVVPNVGYLADGVFHPGDALTVPDEPVRVLLAPVAAPWMKLSEAVDFIRAVGAPVVHPIHDAILSEDGIVIVDRMLTELIGDPFQRIANGDTVTA